MSAEMSDQKTEKQQPATLQVSAEGEVKLAESPPGEKPSTPQPPQDRDPNRMNDFVKVGPSSSACVSMSDCLCPYIVLAAGDLHHGSFP